MITLAGPVLDHDRLTKEIADARRKFAACRIDRSGGRPWRDQGNAPRRIIAAMRRRQCERQTADNEQGFHNAAHDFPPP